MIKRFFLVMTLLSSVMLYAENKVCQVPEHLNSEDKFYSKYLDASGLAVLASAKVDDKALFVAQDILNDMLSKDKRIAEYMASKGCKVMIIGHQEETLDLPEYRHLATTEEQRIYLNKRARGFGGSPEDDFSASCGEENLLFLESDRYVGENILIHEFAHLIQMVALNNIDEDFEPKLKELYAKAQKNKAWENTYAMENPEEYFAEAVQSYFNANRYAKPTNGIHGQVSNRKALKKKDREMYDLLSKYFAPINKSYCK